MEIPSSEVIRDLFYRLSCTSPGCLSLNGECWKPTSDVKSTLPADIYHFPTKDSTSQTTLEVENVPLDRKIVVPNWIRSSCLLPIVLGCGHDIYQPTQALEVPACHVQDEIGGAVGVVLQCLLKCNIDIRRYLFQHLIICGGGAALPGCLHKILFSLT